MLWLTPQGCGIMGCHSHCFPMWLAVSILPLLNINPSHSSFDQEHHIMDGQNITVTTQ
jgi:hypothetical protein